MIRLPWKQKALGNKSAFLYPRRGQCGRLFYCVLGADRTGFASISDAFLDFVSLFLPQSLFPSLCFCPRHCFSPLSFHLPLPRSILLPSLPGPGSAASLRGVSVARGAGGAAERGRRARGDSPFHLAVAAVTGRRNRIHPHAVLQRPLIPLAHLK